MTNAYSMQEEVRNKPTARHLCSECAKIDQEARRDGLLFRSLEKIEELKSTISDLEDRLCKANAVIAELKNIDTGSTGPNSVKHRR